jgi:hypothetical protein
MVAGEAFLKERISAADGIGLKQVTGKPTMMQKGKLR